MSDPRPDPAAPDPVATDLVATDLVATDLTEFEQAVLDVVAELEEGEIVTYGEVAAEIGHPGAARAVGSTLRRRGSTVAWWRVVAANGRLVPGNEKRHQEALAAEGVEVKGGRVTMSR